MIRSGSGGLLAVALVLCAWLAGPIKLASAADFEIVPGSFAVNALDAEGNPDTRAGSHPDRLLTDFALNVEETAAKDLVFELPPGLGGNSNAVPQCPRELSDQGEECPPESQVGEFKAVLSGGFEAALPLFQLEPVAGQPLAFGSKPSFDISLASELRPDFGVTLKATDLPQEPIVEGHVELWGVPADHQSGTTIPRRPFLTLPSRCGPMLFGFQARSRQEGAPWLAASTETAPLEGCQDLSFAPRLGMQLTNPVADSPTGLRMDLSAPTEDDSSERAEAQIEAVTIEFPEGIAVSPGGAAQLAACSDAQLGLDSNNQERCPPSSKVGTVEFSSASEAMVGTLYLGEEHPGERFRLFVVAPGLGGTIKFVGALVVDPVTGRFSAALKGLPPIPIERMSMNFDGGPQALLASPLTCGPAPARASFSPYGGGPTVTSIVSVAIQPRIAGSSCPGVAPFSPQLEIASSTQMAGRANSISARLRRRDGEQLPRRFTVAFPSGLGAALGSVQTCPEAVAGTGACPPESRAGSVLAQVGSGPNPASLRGSVFLTGPYRRSPFGLVMTFPATLGPFHLGTMAVRSAVRVDRRTGRVTVVSDPLPGAVEGLPIRFQSIELALDRPGLVHNPTSCRAASVDGVLEAQGGSAAPISAPFAVKGCGRLGFKPRIGVRFDAGKGRRVSSMLLSARFRRGDSNLRAMKFSLPPALKFATSGIKEICSRLDASLGACPASSRVGTVSARASLLSGRLQGSVYVVQPSGDGLPALGIDLGAGNLQVNLTGRVSVHEGHLVTNIVAMPDLALSAFSMKLGGGDSSLLSLAGPSCVHGQPRRLLAAIAVKAQNGVERRSRPPIATRAGCGGMAGS